MRMKKRAVREPAKRFRSAKPKPHNGHIGPGPKPGPKRAVNLSVDEAILSAAKKMGLNLSQVLEDELRRRTEDVRIAQFQREHRASFESINRYIERNGTMSEALLDLDEPPV
jgi:antitoxin CcdA